MISIKPFPTKTKYESRIHKIEIKDGIPIPSIEYSKNYHVPKQLIKYYSADEYGYKVLKEGKIWASNPLSFNDPFDCSVQMWEMNNFPKDFVIWHLEQLKNKLKEFHIILKETDISDSFESLRRRYFEVFLRTMGIFCLNDNINSELFWGYYNSHEGFSIVFDSEILNSQWKMKPLKVEYDDVINFEKISLIEVEVENKYIFSKLLRWATLKKIEWVHENEWRYIFFDIDFVLQNRQKEYFDEALLEVVLGYKFFIEQVIDFRDNRHSNSIRIFEFKPQDNQYKLHLLSHIYDKGIRLYQIELSDDYKLYKRQLELLEVKNNKVSIFYTDIIKE